MSESDETAPMTAKDDQGDQGAQSADQPAEAEQNESNEQRPGSAIRQDLRAQVEAALLTADRPLTVGRLSEALGAVTAKALRDAVAQLNAVYEQTGRSFRIEQVAGGWQMMTLPAYSQILTALHKTRGQSKLSPAAMETLAIVAYKQPILRAQIESIRGVASGEILRSLMDRHLVKIVGRAEEIGRPMLYGTTRTFLEVFGLANLSDLPQVEQLRPKS